MAQKTCVSDSNKRGSRHIAISLLEYLLMFFVIIEFNTPYTYFPEIQKVVVWSPLLILFLLLIITFGSIQLEGLVILLAIGALFPALNVADGQFGRYIKTYLLLLPLSTLFFLKHSLNEGCRSFLFKFSNIVVCLAVISLFFWIFGSMLEKISYTILIPNSWGSERLIPTYYGIYFETQETMATGEAVSSTIRNSGIFNEAPMHNMVLCIALTVETFLRGKMSKLRIIILIITILTTLSTTGYILLLVIAFLKGFIVLGSQLKKYLVLLLPIIAVVGFSLITTILENKKDTGESSYNSRSADIVRCIEVGLENPVLGIEIFHKADEGGMDKNNYGYSNSLFGIFAHGGFYVFTLYLCSLFMFPVVVYGRIKDKNLLAFQLCFFLLFTFTLSEYKYLTILIMSFNLAYWEKTKYGITSQNYNILES